MSKKKVDRIEWDRTAAMARLLGVPTNRLVPTQYLTSGDLLSTMAAMAHAMEAEEFSLREAYFELPRDAEAMLRSGSSRLTPILAALPRSDGNPTAFGIEIRRTEVCWQRCSRCPRPFNLSCIRREGAFTCHLLAPIVRLVGPVRSLLELPSDLEMPQRDRELLAALDDNPGT